jgi:hypothetical protein
MIRSLRQTHRRLFAVLGIALPVALVAGMAARRPVPTTPSLPDGIVAESVQFAAAQWSRNDLFAKQPIQVALVRERVGVGRFAIGLSAPKDFAKPDLLVYWVAGNTTVADTIPDDAFLLGSFDGSTPLPLPPGMLQSSGILILYSLADHEVVDVSKPISL